jgi:hypothetical protein
MKTNTQKLCSLFITDLMQTIRIQVETNDGCRTIWYEQSRAKNACTKIHDRVLEQLAGLNLKRVDVSLSPATI